MKCNKNKTIFVIEGATKRELELFRDNLNKKDVENIFSNKNCKMFKLIKGEMFEVIEKLEKAKNE